MAHLVPLDFWRDARQHLDVVKPLFWLGETEHYNYQYVFDCSYAWNFMHASESFAKKKTGIDELKATLLDYQKRKLPQTNHLFFTSNHDENSWNGTEYEKYGNAALPFAVLTAAWNGLFLIYSGQEIPNRKRLNFFEKDTIQWNWTNELHSFYKTLNALRNSFDEEQSEVLMLNPSGDRQVLAFLRISKSKQVLVLINISDTVQNIQLEELPVKGTYQEIFTAKKYEAPSLKNLKMEPWNYFVFKKL